MVITFRVVVIRISPNSAWNTHLDGHITVYGEKMGRRISKFRSRSSPSRLSTLFIVLICALYWPMVRPNSQRQTWTIKRDFHLNYWRGRRYRIATHRLCTWCNFSTMVGVSLGRRHPRLETLGPWIGPMSLWLSRSWIRSSVPCSSTGRTWADTGRSFCRPSPSPT